jgi:hypothetical protein
MSEVTRILEAVGQGDPHAAAQLLPQVYFAPCVYYNSPLPCQIGFGRGGCRIGAIAVALMA